MKSFTAESSMRVDSSRVSLGAGASRADERSQPESLKPKVLQGLVEQLFLALEVSAVTLATGALTVRAS